MAEYVAITGASGFIGKHLCLQMIEKKKRFKILRHQQLLKAFSERRGWDVLLQQTSTLVHLAGKAHDAGRGSIEEYRRDNTEFTRALAIAAKAQGVKRFVFVSTVKVHGPYTEEVPFATETPPHPEGPYAMSKFEAEIELQKLHEEGIFEVVIIRPTLVYGTGVKANFLSLIHLVKSRIPLPFASVRNKRSLLYVKNLTDLIYVCLSHPKASGQIFSVSDDNDLSLAEMIRLISQGLHLRPLLFPIPVKLMTLIANSFHRQNLHERLFSNLHVDIEKTKTLLSWRPPYTVKQAFDEMLSIDY